MKKTRLVKIIVMFAITALLLTALPISGSIPAGYKAKADTMAPLNQADIVKELTSKRERFVKQFALSDGSFLAVSYSMPVHYPEKGKWREIDTTMILTRSRKSYRTRSTDLLIQAAKRANKKSMISLKRGKKQLKWALLGKNRKNVKITRQNPKKRTQTDILNENRIWYRGIQKNLSLSYRIYPEKITEEITVKKKQKNRKFTFRINSGSMKVKVKNKRVYFSTKKGKATYTRLRTVLTDAKGVSTKKVKVSYNKKKKTLTITPDKKWWNDKKRKFPVQVRTSYITSEHERDVKVGASYAGAPNTNHTYNSTLLLQANKCTAFAQMSDLTELKSPNVKIRSASIHIKNNTTLKLGAGRTFDTQIHLVQEKWTPGKLTHNNRPTYETTAGGTISIQKKGRYETEITDIVKRWYQGESNYGVALVASNANGSYQANLDKNPYFTVRYELVGFEGAEELKENQDITRDVLTVGQENYYYFDTQPGIAYDLYTTSNMDTQGTLYDEEKNRLGYDDNSGLENNFAFVQSYDGRHYLKVSTKGTATGTYTLTLKKRFEIPEPVGVKGQDKYTITWNAIEHAKEYLVCIYDGANKIGEAVVTSPSYDYIYNASTTGKILGFTVTARENAALTGEASRMIFNTDSQSEWVYTTPMQEKRKNASAVALDGKIYVLGGENTYGSLKSFAAYDTKKKTWETLPDYPGTETGICKAAVVVHGKEIYVIGGQTDTGVNASVLKSVYVFNTETKQWQRKAELQEGRTNLAAAVCKDKVYTFSKAGATDKVDIYDLKADTWESKVMPGTSTVIGAASVDNRIFILKEEGESMVWTEYLPEEDVFEDAGAVCPYTTADRFVPPVVLNGKIYLLKEAETKTVLVYDAYLDQWSEISPMNLVKKDSVLTVSGNELYSIGGEMTGFGILDTVEQYSVKAQTVIKQMLVNKGEAYELQVTAGNLKKGQEKTVVVTVNPDELQIQFASSFEEEEALRQGKDGVTLLKYQPKKGIMVVKLVGSLEQGETYEACQSIPVEAKLDGKTNVEVTLTEK